MTKKQSKKKHQNIKLRKNIYLNKCFCASHLMAFKSEKWKKKKKSNWITNVGVWFDKSYKVEHGSDKLVLMCYSCYKGIKILWHKWLKNDIPLD